MQKNMTDRTPGSYDDFVAYLGTVRTEEELFSRLTYWFAGQNRPEDVLSRSELVEARAKELGFWQGLTFRMERWLTDGKSRCEAMGRLFVRAMLSLCQSCLSASLPSQSHFVRQLP